MAEVLPPPPPTKKKNVMTLIHTFKDEISEVDFGTAIKSKKLEPHDKGIEVNLHMISIFGDNYKIAIGHGIKYIPPEGINYKFNYMYIPVYVIDENHDKVANKIGVYGLKFNKEKSFNDKTEPHKLIKFIQKQVLILDKNYYDNPLKLKPYISTMSRENIDDADKPQNVQASQDEGKIYTIFGVSNLKFKTISSSEDLNNFRNFMSIDLYSKFRKDFNDKYIEQIGDNKKIESELARYINNIGKYIKKVLIDSMITDSDVGMEIKKNFIKKHAEVINEKIFTKKQKSGSDKPTLVLNIVNYLSKSIIANELTMVELSLFEYLFNYKVIILKNIPNTETYNVKHIGMFMDKFNDTLTITEDIIRGKGIATDDKFSSTYLFSSIFNYNPDRLIFVKRNSNKSQLCSFVLLNGKFTHKISDIAGKSKKLDANINSLIRDNMHEYKVQGQIDTLRNLVNSKQKKPVKVVEAELSSSEDEAENEDEAESKSSTPLITLKQSAEEKSPDNENINSNNEGDE